MEVKNAPGYSHVVQLRSEVIQCHIFYGPPCETVLHQLQEFYELHVKTHSVMPVQDMTK